jgi:soluble lytic murein transglycosylase-like protein
VCTGSADMIGRESANTVRQLRKIIQDHETKQKKPIKHKQKIVKAVIKYSKLHNLNPFELISVMKLESGFDIKAHNSKSKDYGLMQINAYHVRVSKLSKSRLLSDIDYNVKIGSQILAQFKHRYPSDYVCRYNIGTTKVPSPRQIKKCTKYRQKIELYAGMWDIK